MGSLLHVARDVDIRIMNLERGITYMVEYHDILKRKIIMGIIRHKV